MYVVTEPCKGCKFTDCVEVCPVDCFYEGDDILYINPDQCIGCGACVPECPVEAIFAIADVPEVWRDYLALNAEMSLTAPPIDTMREPLAQCHATAAADG